MTPRTALARFKTTRAQYAERIINSWPLFTAFVTIGVWWKYTEHQRRINEIADRAADRVIEKLEARDEQKMQETLNKLEEWSTN